MLIGSANFSGESVNDNDENALLIEGDGWAAVGATEFLRVFEHYRFRNHIEQIAERVDTQTPPVTEPSGWVSSILSAPEEAVTQWFLDLEGADGVSDGVLGAVAQANYRLTEDDGWAGAYFAADSPRCREREVFAP